MRTTNRLFAAGLASLVVSGNALSAEIADGIYECRIGSAVLGNIKVEAGRYSGPIYGEDFQEFYPLEVTDAGTISWGGPLGGISASGTVVSSVLADAGGGRVAFAITIQNERGNFQTIGCNPR